MLILTDTVGLTQTYTNYSISAKGATMLSKYMFSSAKIMVVTGQK